MTAGAAGAAEPPAGPLAVPAPDPAGEPDAVEPPAQAAWPAEAGRPVERPEVGTAPLLNVANGLTGLRLLLIPVFVAFTTVSELTHAGWQVAAALTFGVASITDYVDGWVARRHNLVTSFGKVADPIADKALTGTALVLLSGYDVVPWWLTIVIIGRELGVTALRFLVLRHGVIPASPGGKLKTLTQSLAIGWLLWPLPDGFASVGLVLMYVAAVLTVGTGVDYVVRAMRLRRVTP